MKVLLVHNEYRKFSGEEQFFHSFAQLLRAEGDEVSIYLRNSNEMGSGIRSEVVGFKSGIWSSKAKAEFEAYCEEYQPDIIQIQNLYPFISSSILSVSKRRKIPVIYAAHNYRLFCPTGLMLRNGSPCEKCARGLPVWGVLHNCEEYMPKSLGYTLRTISSKSRIIRNSTVITVLSEFQRRKFISWGICPSQIEVLENFVIPKVDSVDKLGPIGDYVGFVGRISSEKGIDILIRVADELPDIPFRLAGAVREGRSLVEQLPENVTLCGHLSGTVLNQFYMNSRFLVVPSVCYEAFGLSAAEAMTFGKPVIASRIGGLSSLVIDGKTGFLVEPGNISMLKEAISKCWYNYSKYSHFGASGRERIINSYSWEQYYIKWKKIALKAINGY